MSLLGRRSRPYMLQRVTPMIFLEQLRGLDVFNGLPGVVAFRVPLPLDQVLELSPPAMTAMVPVVEFAALLCIRVRRGNTLLQSS